MIDPEAKLFDIVSYDLALSTLARTYADRGEQIPQVLFEKMNETSVELVAAARALGGDVTVTIERAIAAVADFEGETAPGFH